MDPELKQYLAAMEARLVSLFASEIGSLHTQITKAEERIVARIDAVDARQRHDAGLTTTLMELVLKQTRWHEQTDNAVADMAARQSEFSRRLDEQRGKQ
jgi:hypothetical protein